MKTSDLGKVKVMNLEMKIFFLSYCESFVCYIILWDQISNDDKYYKGNAVTHG